MKKEWVLLLLVVVFGTVQSQNTELNVSVPIKIINVEFQSVDEKGNFRGVIDNHTKAKDVHHVKYCIKYNSMCSHDRVAVIGIKLYSPLGMMMHTIGQETSEYTIVVDDVVPAGAKNREWRYGWTGHDDGTPFLEGRYQVVFYCNGQQIYEDYFILLGDENVKFLKVNGRISIAERVPRQGTTLKYLVATDATKFDVVDVPSWCKVVRGDTSIEISCAPNTTGGERNACLRVKAGNKVVRIDLFQY